MLEHQHLLIMGDLSDPPKSEPMIEEWMASLIRNIHMKALIAPKAKYCDVEGNRGITCIAAIETSHIVFHSWDEIKPYKLQLDIYSCSVLKLSTVWKALEEFRPIELKYKFYDRSNGFQLLDEGLR